MTAFSNGRRLIGSCFSSLSLSLLWRRGRDYYAAPPLSSSRRQTNPSSEYIFRNVIIIEIEGTRPNALPGRLPPGFYLLPRSAPPPPPAAPLPLRGVSGISGCGLGGLCGRATVRRSPEPSETKRPLKRMRSERTAGKREIAKSKPRRGPWRGLSGPPPFPIHPRHPIRRPSSPAGQI